MVCKRRIVLGQRSGTSKRIRLRPHKSKEAGNSSVMGFGEYKCYWELYTSFLLDSKPLFVPHGSEQESMGNSSVILVHDTYRPSWSYLQFVSTTLLY